MKLISMTEFVLEQEKQMTENDSYEFAFGMSSRMINYAKFLTKQLELGYFVPCDEDGNVMLLPGSAPIYTHSLEYIDEYQQVLDKVIFEGFEVKSKNIISSGFEEMLFLPFNNGNTEVYVTDFTQENTKETLCYTIEDIIKYNLTITPQSVKRFNL